MTAGYKVLCACGNENWLYRKDQKCSCGRVIKYTDDTINMNILEREDFKQIKNPSA